MTSARPSASLRSSWNIARRCTSPSERAPLSPGSLVSVPPRMTLDISPLQSFTSSACTPLSGAAMTDRSVVSGITVVTVEDIASSAAARISTSSSFARASFDGSRPVAYFPTRSPRPDHSAKAIQSRTDHRLNALYQTIARPRPSRVGYVPNARGVCRISFPRGKAAGSSQGMPGKRAKRVSPLCAS